MTDVIIWRGAEDSRWQELPTGDLLRVDGDGIPDDRDDVEHDWGPLTRVEGDQRDSSAR